MQTILAIETSVPNASLASLQNGKVSQYEFESHRQQNQLLFPPLQEILKQLNGSSIDTILIGTGPGSYSGSRIAIAAAQGVATVHHAALAGVCSFFAVEDLDPSSAVAVGDARRGSYFYHDLATSDLHVKPTLGSLEETITRIEALGDKERFTFESQNQLPIADVRKLRPTAKGLIAYWNKLSAEQQTTLTQLPLEPLYLRAPFITKSKKSHPLIGS